MATVPINYINKLKENLNFSKIDHNIEILKEVSLKNAHIYCVISRISAQLYGPLIEHYIINKFKFKKSVSSKCIGDCSKNSKNIEIKASVGGEKHFKFNWVQLRLSHDIHYYLFTAYYLNNENVDNGGELFIFYIPKESIIFIIQSFGSYAHGTKKENGDITLQELLNKSNKKEYALRAKYNSDLWVELLKFRVNETDL